MVNMMIKIIDGDLLTAKTDVIAHQVNCQGKFNSGVAKAIREHDFGVYKDYHEYCKANNPEVLLGTIRWCTAENGQKIANLFAQNSYGYDGKQYTDLGMLRTCLLDLRLICDSFHWSLAMPYKIGSVRGGAKWEDVYAMIEEIFGDFEYGLELWRLDKR